MDRSNFLDWPETYVRGVDGFGIPDFPNGVRGSHLAIFPDIRDALLRFVGLERTTIERLMLALVVAAAAVPR